MKSLISILAILCMAAMQQATGQTTPNRPPMIAMLAGFEIPQTYTGGPITIELHRDAATAMQATDPNAVLLRMIKGRLGFTKVSSTTWAASDFASPPGKVGMVWNPAPPPSPGDTLWLAVFPWPGIQYLDTISIHP